MALICSVQCGISSTSGCWSHFLCISLKHPAVASANHVRVVGVNILIMWPLNGGFNNNQLIHSGYYLIFKVFCVIGYFVFVPSRLESYTFTVWIWVSTPLQLILPAFVGNKNVCINPHSTRRLAGLDEPGKTKEVKSSQWVLIPDPSSKTIPRSFTNWLPPWFPKSCQENTLVGYVQREEVTISFDLLI